MPEHSAALQVAAWTDTHLHVRFTVKNDSEEDWVLWNVYSKSTTGIMVPVPDPEATQNAAAILYGADGVALLVQGRTPPSPNYFPYWLPQPYGSRVAAHGHLTYELSLELPLHEWGGQARRDLSGGVKTEADGSLSPIWKAAQISQFDVCVAGCAGGKARSLDGYPTFVEQVDGGRPFLLHGQAACSPAAPVLYSRMNDIGHADYTREYFAGAIDRRTGAPPPALYPPLNIR